MPKLYTKHKLLTKYIDTPERALCPFDSVRDGSVTSEGAGIVVLEEFEHDKA